EVLKQYNYNSSLKFKKYSEQWYVVTVYISGVAYKGYINKADVAEDKDINNVYGLANKDLDVYTEATEESKIRKSYVQGSKLKFKNYNESWYTAVVYVNGVRYTGYIAHKDIELIDSTQMKMTGLANKQRTKIYSKASTNSSILKDYEYGHSLIYRSLSKNWYEATVYIKGKPETGYINKNDVTQKLNDFQYGYASTDKVNVYKSTSRKSDVLKSYQYG